MCKHNTQVNKGLQITAEHGHGEPRAEVLEAAKNVIRPQIHTEWVERPPGPADRTNVKAQKVMWDKKEGMKASHLASEVPKCWRSVCVHSDMCACRMQADLEGQMRVSRGPCTSPVRWCWCECDV